jgi:hypothetical protein
MSPINVSWSFTMSFAPESCSAVNLRRWTESGQPRRWVESRCGIWDHADWLTLLGNLRHTAFWPMDAEQIGAVLEGIKHERQTRDNLRRWDETGQARRWVEQRQGRWEHADWLALLEELRRSEFWPLTPEAVGGILEGLKCRWWNLRLWRESGQARAWVAAHHGDWAPADWLALADSLRRSVYWPLDLDAVAEVLDGLKDCYRNLRRWRQSGAARAWVEQRQGHWDHGDWGALMSGLQQSDYWPLPPDAVGQALEESRAEWGNLRRWVVSGQPLLWVELRGGKWEHDDWLGLVAGLRRSEFWPLDLDAVGQVLESLRGGSGTVLPLPAGAAEFIAARQAA